MSSALDRAQKVASLLAQWNREMVSAQEKVASGRFDSFVIDSLSETAGRNNAVFTLNSVLGRLAELELIENNEIAGIVFPAVITDEEKAMVVIEGAAEYLQERILGWYKPNSTSVSSVEIDLYANRANIEALKALRGTRF